MKSLICVVLLRTLGFLIVAASFQAASASTVLQSGEDWLKWNDETKINYVSAYLWGHARGYLDGCTTGQHIYSGSSSTALPGEKCIGKQSHYSKKLEDYAAAITEFYSSYPNDKQVPVFQVLDGMSDSRNLSIRPMHEQYGPCRETLAMNRVSWR